MPYLDTIKLNASGKQNIRDAADYLQTVLERVGVLSRGGAKEVLRARLIYFRVRDVTLERIGHHGIEQGLFEFHVARGFSKIGEPLPAGFVRDHIEAFIDDTTEPGKKKLRGAMRQCLHRIIRDYGDPTIEQNVVTIAQDLNEKTRSGTVDDKDLGTFRSFVVWGIENGILKGDLRLMKHPEELVTDGFRRGMAVARIQPNSMTNTKGQWLWKVRHADGVEKQEWHTVSEMKGRMDELAAEQVDDEVIDLRGLLPEEPVTRPSRHERLVVLRNQLREALDEVEDLIQEGRENAVASEG